ncbi:MAG: hypothetical protein ABSF50_01800 [Burkholderiaceae bacterium]
MTRPDPPSREAFPSIRFDTRTGFDEQLLAATGSAQREIWLADFDFSRWPLNSPKIEEALQAFLLASRANRVQLLAASSSHLTQQAPRFMRLLRLFGHALVCRQVPEQVATRFAEDCSFAIVDRARMVRRFHRDTMRGAAEFHPNEVGPWVDQFQSLWDEATPGISATTLGL